jgi:hypothetical protein
MSNDNGKKDESTRVVKPGLHHILKDPKPTTPKGEGK